MYELSYVDWMLVGAVTCIVIAVIVIRWLIEEEERTLYSYNCEDRYEPLEEGPMTEGAEDESHRVLKKPHHATSKKKQQRRKRQAKAKAKRRRNEQ